MNYTSPITMMNYTMKEPCDECPFLKGSGFSYTSLVQHASGEFPCHKKCKLEDGVYVERNNTPHCAGALIFHELRHTSHQMMRIAERLGMYDHTKLNMEASVVSSPKDCRRRKLHSKGKPDDH